MQDYAVYAVHHLVSHPLLVLWPRAGRWLHEVTIGPGHADSCALYGGAEYDLEASNANPAGFLIAWLWSLTAGLRTTHRLT